MMFGLGLCLSGWKGKSVHFRNSGVLLIFLCFSVLELSEGNCVICLSEKCSFQE